MFVRFRQIARRPRLQVSVIETRRIGGRVRHEHVASIGSIALPATLVDRVKFWAEANTRLDRLANRIDVTAIRSRIAERVSVPSEAERADVKAVLATNPAERRHSIRLAEICDVIGDRYIPLLARHREAAAERHEHRAVARLHATIFRNSR